MHFRKSCFAKLCCCCCNKEDGGIHDLRNNTWEQADGKKDDRVRQDETRAPGYDTGPEDSANKMKHENRASQNRKGLGKVCTKMRDYQMMQNTKRKGRVKGELSQ